MNFKMFFAILALVLTVNYASAQTPQKTTTPKPKACYVDSNKNEICDKHEKNRCVVISCVHKGKTTDKVSKPATKSTEEKISKLQKQNNQ